MTTARRPGFEYMALDDFEELLADKPADEKWELIGGRVVRLPRGVRWEHKRIIQNVMVALVQHIDRTGSHCHVFTETFWLKEKLLDLAVFPDVMVYCGPLPPGASAISDPIILMEVVSGGSVQRDCIEKWAQYRKLESLRQYVLIERNRMWVDVFDRTASGWAVQTFETPHDGLALSAVDFTLPLSEIYRDVIDATA